MLMSIKTGGGHNSNVDVNVSNITDEDILKTASPVGLFDPVGT